MEIILIRNFLIAIALGALIGLEREYARYLKKGHDFAGIRTFPLITLFGALAAYFGNLYSIWIFIACIVLVGALIILAYFALSHDCEEKHTGTTSEVAAFLAFFIGAISYYGEILLAVSLTIAITIILYARSFLHNLAERMKPNEMEDTLKFISLSCPKISNPCEIKSGTVSLSHFNGSQLQINKSPSFKVLSNSLETSLSSSFLFLFTFRKVSFSRIMISYLLSDETSLSP